MGLPPSGGLLRLPTIHEAILYSRYVGRAFEHPWFAFAFDGPASHRWLAWDVQFEIRDHDVRAAIEATPCTTGRDQSHAYFPATIGTVEDDRHLATKQRVIGVRLRCGRWRVSFHPVLMPRTQIAVAS